MPERCRSKRRSWDPPCSASSSCGTETVAGIPGYIVALVAGTAFVTVVQIPVDTIGTRFGGIPSGWPALHVPQFRPELILTLLSPTLTVAMLGAIESLMSAVVADKMTGTRHNSNVELFAQGIANIASPFVGGLPATGALARTATNIRSGGRTPVAGMIHAASSWVSCSWLRRWRRQSR